MPDTTDEREHSAGVSRRELLKAMPMIAGAAVTLGTQLAPQAAHAQATKVSHEVAKYQDMPHDGQQCSTCVLFQPPSACKFVVNPISPQGWCMFYAKKS